MLVKNSVIRNLALVLTVAGLSASTFSSASLSRTTHTNVTTVAVITPGPDTIIKPYCPPPGTGFCGVCVVGQTCPVENPS
jgi:hypothetical protein